MPTTKVLNRKPKQLFPFGDKVVVIPAPKKDKTDGGVILPDDAQRLPKHGKVFMVGPDVPETIKPGMNVLFAQYAGHELEIDDGQNEPVTVLILGYKSLDAEIK